MTKLSQQEIERLMNLQQMYYLLLSCRVGCVRGEVAGSVHRDANEFFVLAMTPDP